jgi:hypothetical protein
MTTGARLNDDDVANWRGNWTTAWKRGDRRPQEHIQRKRKGPINICMRDPVQMAKCGARRWDVMARKGDRVLDKTKKKWKRDNTMQYGWRRESLVA